MKEEIWKDYDKKYKVSNYGKVWNKITNLECKVYIDKVGYHRVSVNGKNIGAHRMVALTFIPNPENKPTVNHIDADKSNNYVDNLEWATHKEQSKHISINSLNPLSMKCCLVDDNDNIVKVFNSMCQTVLVYPELNYGNVGYSCTGRINRTKNLKFRLYNEEDNSYVKTKWDLDKSLKSKGRYKKGIYCELNGITFTTQQECADYFKVRQFKISSMLRGKLENIYKLRYLNKELKVVEL